MPERRSESLRLGRVDSRTFDRSTGKAGSGSRYLADVSLFERRAAGLYHNTAVVLNARGEIAGRYRKMHIPDDPLYYEKFYFTPGDLGFAAHRTEAGRLGVLLCWDQWFPEAARATTLAGADFLFYPTPTERRWRFSRRPSRIVPSSRSPAKTSF